MALKKNPKWKAFEEFVRKCNFSINETKSIEKEFVVYDENNKYIFRVLKLALGPELIPETPRLGKAKVEVNDGYNHPTIRRNSASGWQTRDQER